MPRKPSTILVMHDYPPFSAKRWYPVIVNAVDVSPRSVVFELLVVDSTDQAGRKFAHTLPAILTPNSPLAAFLRDGFGVELSPDEPFDLVTVRGRRLEAKVIQADVAAAPVVALVHLAAPDASTPSAMHRPRGRSMTLPTNAKEPTHGLE